MDELFPVWRHHAVFTDSPVELVQAEGQHRGHAIVEQVFADVTSGPLAHLPSGRFAANAAWLSIAAMAHNLLRAAGALASLAFAKARAATIRRDLIAVAARTARHGTGPPRPPPARGLAPRAGMAEPVGRGLRPARRSGLTSPEPVTHPHGRKATRDPGPGPGPVDKPQNSQRQENHARKQPARRKPETAAPAFTRWIEAKPKLRLVRSVVSRLAWCFTRAAGWRSDYFRVSGIGAPIRSKASRWALVGSASMGTVALVPAKRTWLRVRVARCSRRPRKLR